MDQPALKNKVSFFRLLSVSQNAGLGIRDALLSIAKSEPNPTFQGWIVHMIDSLTEGASLAEALEEYPKFFNSDEIELIKSAEITGNMSKVLSELSDELERDQEINQKIKKAMTYPVMVLSIAIIAVAVILIMVLPPMIEMFWDNKLPGITIFMVNVSDFLIAHRWKLLGWIIILVTTYKFLYEKVLVFKMAVDKLLLKIPAIGSVIKNYYMYKFANLLSQFYEAGVSPVVSLKLLWNIFANHEYKEKMYNVRNDLESGFTLYESLVSSSLFDPILIQIINVGENTGSLTEVLKKMSNFYRNNFQNAVDTAMSLIEPILMMFVAAIVGVIVAAVFLPMADMISAVSVG